MLFLLNIYYIFTVTAAYLLLHSYENPFMDRLTNMKLSASFRWKPLLLLSIEMHQYSPLVSHQLGWELTLHI